MNKKNLIILTISILIFIGALVLFIYAKTSETIKDEPNSNSKSATNSSAKSDKPHFYDIDGNEFSLEDFSDKPNVILLWKSDDSKSYTMINLITKYYEEYKDKINFLTINVNEPDIDLELKDNVKDANFTIPIYFDTDLTLYDEFYYEKLPDLLFINKNGEIDKEALETIDEDAFSANLDLLIENY